ncbi:hypothetical protein SAMN02910298_00102 [Pseudobutyrivibrio sp. YE44]|uniref:hypothetical protein n=1 Tax=Pseudobutyrivibrio sp. YE44 TaxID=1520802 RepID=UPI00088C6684|nr:hypothetical protein [Pseudobutyrivibrio sp. YE44]SDB05264.1 hypothetical protein SAMN02910298_00102 [Pseudobutyrivibrio sp. YE44]
MDNQDYTYTQAPNNAPAPYTDMSVGDWLITMILTCIPIVGFICLIVWAVSSSPEKRARKNWAIAQFIMCAIAIVLSIILVACLGVGAASMAGSY